MVTTKTIQIDEYANDLLNKILSKEKGQDSISNSGLLIGTIDESKDYILYVVSTPDDDSTGVGSGGGVGESGDTDSSKPSKSNSNSNSNKFNDDLIINHAIQVHDMLVGGVDVLGIYMVDSTPAKAKQILFDIYDQFNSLEYYKKMKINSDRLLFLVDSKTNNINMKHIDVNDSSKSSTLSPCEIEVKKNLLINEFSKLNSNYNLNFTFNTPNVKSHSLLKEHFYNAVSVDEMLDESKFVCLFNDVLVDDKKQLSDIKGLLDKETREKSDGLDQDGGYEVTLMENLSKPRSSQTSKNKNGDQANLEPLYELTGVCNLVVLFHHSMCVNKLKRLLIYDLMRSLYARIRLLVEDLDARKDIIGDAQLEDPSSNDVSAIEESYQTPNRIHIYLANKEKERKEKFNFILSDYVFPDETDADISERVKSLFNIEIKEELIIFVEDLPPEIKQSKSQDKLNGLGGLSNTNQTNSNSSSLNLNQNSSNTTPVLAKSVYYGLAILVALISTLVFYYSYKAADFINYESEE